MFLGLTQPFEQGKMIPVTLVFERAGEIAVEIPVDLARRPTQGDGAMHGSGG
jgi:copper(I)-binding protein